jgi:signal recognition particle GTPase
VKTFKSDAEVQKFVSKKVRENEKKGYKKESKQKLKKETKTAQALGHQNKIKRMLWVNKDNKKLTQIDAYDPNQYVYVEILNSWSKKMTRLLLHKDTNWMIQGSITEMGREIHAGKMTKLGYSSFAEAVRTVLKEMAEVIAEALKTVKFGAGGVRNLFDDDAQPTKSVSEALASIDTSGFDSSVVHTFAAMGARSLEL